MTTVAQYRDLFRAGLTNPMRDNNEEFAQWLVERINALEAEKRVVELDQEKGE